MNIDSNMIQMLVNALNRNSEIVALTAGLKDSECTARCGRFATKQEPRGAMRICDECAVRYFPNGEWEEGPFAKRVRRLEALISSLPNS